MKPEEKLNAIHQTEATSVLEGFLPGSANLETDRSVPPAGNFEEAIAELSDYVRLHGTADGFVYSKMQTIL